MRPLTLCAALFAVAGTFAAWAAGPPMAIVASTVPDLKPGDLVVEGQEIVVPPGASVQLFTVTGREINVSGPFSGVPGGEGAPPPEDKLEVLAAALFGQTDITVGGQSIGALLPGGLGNFTGRPSSNANDRTLCLAGDVKTVLVQKADIVGAAKLVSVDDGQSAPLAWSGETKTVDWPSALPPKDGGQYMVDVEGREQSRFTVRLMSEAPNGAGRLAQMAAAGCREQVSDAIASLQAPAAGAATSD